MRCAPREGEGRVLATLTRKQGDGDPFPAIAAQLPRRGIRHHAIPVLRRPGRSARAAALSLAQGEVLVRHARSRPRSGQSALRSPAARLSPAAVRCRAGSIISTSRCCRGSPIMRSRACRSCRPPRSWRWRSPPRELRRPDAPVLEVRDVEVRRPLPFDKGRTREIRASIGSEDGDWELASRPRLSTSR